jgi:UDP-2,3-diacylglucosamine hydrolase
MRTIFIADAHLQKETDPAYRDMLQFLGELSGSTSELFIMGDFFEFWIGYPQIPFTHYLPLLETLRSLHNKGTAITYFEGNHDFHMGPFFSDTLKARIFPESATLILGGRNTFLCHGDQANPRDIPYQMLRTILHSSLTRLLTKVIPPSVAMTIAERMGRKGRMNLPAKGENPFSRPILREFAATLFAKGYDQVIAGHFHLPFIEESKEFPGKRLVSLGDWATRRSYAELVDGELVLKTYH